jgi:hypothetical protein
MSSVIGRRSLVAAVVFLLPAVLSAEGQQVVENPLRLRVEAFSLGFDLANGNRPSGTLSEVHFERGRWRLGSAAAEGIIGLEFVGFMPVRVDYILWEHPIWYEGRLHGMLPDVALHVSGYWLSNAGRPIVIRPVAGRMEVVAGLDFLGVGMNLSAGVVGTYVSNYDGTSWKQTSGLTPVVELRARLLTFGADLAGGPR